MRSRSKRARGLAFRSTPRSATRAGTDALTLNVADPSSPRYSSSSYSYCFFTRRVPHAESMRAAATTIRIHERIWSNDILHFSPDVPADAFPHRRQLPDVSRVSRLSRQGTVEPGRT